MEFNLDDFHRNVSDTDLLQDLHAVSKLLLSSGEKLTYRSDDERGKFSASTISARFGTWNTALKKAGIEPVMEKLVSAEDLFDNLRTVWIYKGKQPVFRDMSRAPSRFTASTYSARFGGWRKALEEFVKCVASDEESFGPAARQTRSVSSGKSTKRAPSLSLRFLIMKRDGFRCVRCGRSPATELGLTLEVDHILAWSRDGETREDNLETLCFDCNRGKGSAH